MSEYVLDSRRDAFSQEPARRESARRESARHESAEKGSGRAALQRGLGILLGAVFAALLATAAFLIAPSLLRLGRFEVLGAETLSSAEVVEASLVQEGAYLFSIEPGRVETALRAHPRIASAEVMRLFPNGLRLAIRERKPVAFVLAEIEGCSRLVALDAEGVAFASELPASAGSGKAGSSPAGARGGTESLFAASRGLPVLSGLRFEGFRLGMRLPATLLPLLSSLASIEASSPALLAAFSEIRVVKPRFGEIELLLYPLHHRIPVRATASLNEATLRSIILVLDVLSSQGLAGDAAAGPGGAASRVEEIDFRTGTIVYRIKEGQSG